MYNILSTIHYIPKHIQTYGCIDFQTNPGTNCPCFIIIIIKEFIFPYKTKYYPCFIGKYLLRFCPKNNTNKTTYYIDLIYCDLWYIKRAGF